VSQWAATNVLRYSRSAPPYSKRRPTRSSGQQGITMWRQADRGGRLLSTPEPGSAKGGGSGSRRSGRRAVSENESAADIPVDHTGNSAAEPTENRSGRHFGVGRKTQRAQAGDILRIGVDASEAIAALALPSPDPRGDTGTAPRLPSPPSPSPPNPSPPSPMSPSPMPPSLMSASPMPLNRPQPRRSARRGPGVLRPNPSRSGPLPRPSPWSYQGPLRLITMRLITMRLGGCGAA
jgi:hypothetical protein